MGNSQPMGRFVSRRGKRPSFVERKDNEKRSDDPRDLQFHQRLQDDIVEEAIYRDRSRNLRDGL